jgi:glucose-6-phosphate 1-dehydrogenase
MVLHLYVNNLRRHERLLLDCMLSDSTLFTARDGVEPRGLLQGILDEWKDQPPETIPA